GAAGALPLRVVQKQPHVARDHPALRRDANGDFVRLGALADDGVGAHELDAARPQLRRARLANRLEGGCHTRRILRAGNYAELTSRETAARIVRRAHRLPPVPRTEARAPSASRNNSCT